MLIGRSLSGLVFLVLSLTSEAVCAQEPAVSGVDLRTGNQLGHRSVLGIHLGMNFQEAERRVREHMQVLHELTAVQPQTPCVDGPAIASLSSGKMYISRNEIVILHNDPPAEADTVIAIIWQVRYPNASRSEQDVLREFRSKYGAEAQSQKSRYHWREAGDPSPPANLDACPQVQFLWSKPARWKLPNGDSGDRLDSTIKVRSLGGNGDFPSFDGGASPRCRKGLTLIIDAQKGPLEANVWLYDFEDSLSIRKSTTRIEQQPIYPASSGVVYDFSPARRTVDRLLTAGRFDEARPIAQCALAAQEQHFGPNDPNTVNGVLALAALYEKTARPFEAEPYYKRALAVIERGKAEGRYFLEADSKLMNVRGALANAYMAAHRYSEAEPLLKQVLEFHEAKLGKGRGPVPLGRSSGTGGVEYNLLTQSDIDVSQTLISLSSIYEMQGHLDKAEQLLQRPLGHRNIPGLPPWLNTAPGPDILERLANIKMRQGDYSAAKKLYETAQKYTRKQKNVDLRVQTGLAAAHEALAEYEKAEEIYSRAINTYEKERYLDRSLLGSTLQRLGVLLTKQERFDEAERFLRQGLVEHEVAFGPDHPAVGLATSAVGSVFFARGDWRGAKSHFEKGAGILLTADQRVKLDLSQSLRVGGALQQAELRHQFAQLVTTADQIGRQAGAASDPVIAKQAFVYAQHALSSSAAQALAEMSARHGASATSDPTLVRERQDLVREWHVIDEKLIAASSKDPHTRNLEGEERQRARRKAIVARIDAVDLALRSKAPKYAELAQPDALAVADVQRQLADDEALVLLLDTDDRFTPAPQGTFIWVVTNRDVRWLRSEMGSAALQREVAALRCGLDATAWYGEGVKRCADLLKLPIENAPQDGAPLPFDTTRAHEIYRSLLGGSEDLIRGKHLLIVPSGALTTLPFQVLVTKAPTSTDLATAAWLIRDHALTVLPSVAALAALRRTAKPSTASKPMIGFANPLLDGDQEHARHGVWYKHQAERARAETGCAATPKQRTAALRSISRGASPVPQTGGLADLGHLKMQTPLPETADEICAVARSIGADVGDMRIGARATETEVKRLSEVGDLAKYHILHFATHGLLAGQLSGAREPGLILTPPATATLQDDGYLSGSDIAGLKLDADWVILSACNTAGGASEGEAAEALSGLARMFFYAGTRALLVSHWEVDSDAAVKLVTGAAGALAKDKAIGRAEALRRAMLAVRADTTRPAGWVPASHPAVWAPFVVVGEGGAKR